MMQGGMEPQGALNQEKQRPSDCAASAQMAEDCLQRALQAVRANDFESAKFRDPFRRRYTAAWCYAEADVIGRVSAPRLTGTLTIAGVNRKCDGECEMRNRHRGDEQDASW